MNSPADIKGMELCRRYYREACLPVIQNEFPDKLSRMAFGLVGDGSECYGFDDMISRDHDFGPRIQVWLTAEDYKDFGEPLQELIGSLSKSFLGFEGVNTSEYGEGREGVFTVGGFYTRFIGMPRAPETLREWRLLPEVNLSIATNGEVWSDPPGEFSGIRAVLKAGYPADVRHKKLAARAMKAAQSGQYNYSRSLRRKESVAAAMATAEFMESACSMIYLLNDSYRPFYKWMHRGLSALPFLGQEAYRLIKRLAETPDGADAAQTIEEISALIISGLREKGLTGSNSDFLLDHAPYIQREIKDPYLRGLPVFAE